MLHEYDATQDKCPLPLVKMRMILKTMHPDDICLIRISDKGSLKDIPKYLTSAGYIFTERILDITSVELSIKNR
jgi:TusA-related sulfurtransferase